MYPKVYLYKRIKDARILIDRHYAEPIDLDYIAKRVYLSKYHFLRLFKEAHGTSPHKYLMQKRITKAKVLLSTELTIAQVCHEVGFESVQSFSHLFKRSTGMSPGKYRKELISESSE
ncbi:MAG: helix-turn-helix transcriptional regulator [Roseivirga sp.]|nr:helix-turn-helix transcriptional regulator [Roseivirga sp.]